MILYNRFGDGNRSPDSDSPFFELLRPPGTSSRRSTTSSKRDPGYEMISPTAIM